MLELLLIHPIMTLLGAALLLATIGILTRPLHGPKTRPTPDSSNGVEPVRRKRAKDSRTDSLK